LATAETARFSSRVNGRAREAACCALTIRDAAISSIARVIFLVAITDCRR